MSETDRDGEGLAAMLGDALVEEICEADLLLRYGRDPEALEPAERERVESYLAASPAHPQQLRSLLRFVEARAEGVGDEGPPTAGRVGGGAVVEMASHPRWRPQAAWIGGAIAAGLVAGLLYFGLGQDLAPGVAPGVQLADEGTGRDESSIFTTPDVPEITRRLDPPSRSQERALAQTDEANGVTPGSAAIKEPTTGDGPSLAEKAPASPPAPAAETSTDGRIEPERTRGEGEAREPLLLAMNVSGPLRYTRPADAIELASPGGLRSTGSGLPVLQALAPSHVARTLSARPTLYWYLSEDTDRSLELVLADRISIDPLLEVTMEGPVAAGIHRLQLAEHGIALEPGKEYRWFVSLESNERIASEDLVARGALLVVDEGTELKDALEAAPIGERGRIYAEQGLWYDALDFISRRIEDTPRDAHLRELRANLLEQVGVSEAAYYDRRAPSVKIAP
jgi:hypothetical protein